MLPSIGVASAKDGGDGGASVIDAPRTPKQHTKLFLHW
jgi:hypothetical protein